MALAQKSEIRWASGGIGTSQHLAGELFVQMSGLKMVHVPYRGTGPALNDLAGGVVDAYFGDPATLGIIKGGKARAMAVTSGERWPAIADVPTLGEAVPGYEAWNWYGLDGPPGIPAPVVTRLSEAVAKVMSEPATRKKYDDNGLHPATLSHDDYVAFIKRDSEVWGKVIRTGNIKPED
jgi:tripartite-type tricarboxylate transporter receptor subunit TctC